MKSSPLQPDIPAAKAYLVASLARAGLQLQGSGFPSDGSVHELRKALKRARAALRVLRDATGEAAYRTDNAACRDAGRVFRDARDAASLLEAFDALRARHPRRLSGLALDRPRRIVRANLVAARQNLFRAGGLPCVQQALKDARKRAASRPVARAQAAAAAGLRRIYRRGRKAFAFALDQRTPDALHEWRKQVKYLQNALHALFPEPHGRATKPCERASMLADVLGDDHDLAALEHELGGVAYAVIDPEAKRVLLELIRRDRAKLQQRARALGWKLYARKPRRMLERLGFAPPEQARLPPAARPRGRVVLAA